MPARGQHRRARTPRRPITRTRTLAITGTSAAALALPFLTATTASAAPSYTSSTSLSSSTSSTTTYYANNLDGWIRESLDIMAQNGIPGTYDGIYRNIIRESSGNPYAINNWDSNAAAGTPSKGLLQVIDPTFAAYHVAGTAYDPYDPIANITAACNYAAARYGSIDNVYGAY
ncbi:transglycosylase SLT domain-containing protein [Streptomyces sp. NPDC020898]|uniref:transglycosylase SLT domain-containing protein n=1 Tax=Streptomyces sp. NPDC020898 TaxID=3365101 RepID=UPI0037BB2372